MTLLWEAGFVCLGVTGNVANANEIHCSLIINSQNGIANLNFTSTRNLLK